VNCHQQQHVATVLVGHGGSSSRSNSCHHSSDGAHMHLKAFHTLKQHTVACLNASSGPCFNLLTVMAVIAVTAVTAAIAVTACCRNYARACSPSAPDSQSIAAATIQLEATRGRVPELPEEFVLPVASASGTCNAYLPNGPSTLPRYLWVMQYLVANGMYVMVSGVSTGQHPAIVVCRRRRALSKEILFSAPWWHQRFGGTSVVNTS
jgi:hypothetical protein